MRIASLLCLNLLFFQPEHALAWELGALSGKWRGTGRVHSFEGMNRQVRCRLEIQEQESGRVDFQGVCADPAGAQSFGVYLWHQDGEVNGGRLSSLGAEVEPVLNGQQVKNGFTLDGAYRDETIRIALEHSNGMITMTSTRIRADQSEVVSVTYDRR